MKEEKKCSSVRQKKKENKIIMKNSMYILYMIDICISK